MISDQGSVIRARLAAQANTPWPARRSPSSRKEEDREAVEVGSYSSNSLKFSPVQRMKSGFSHYLSPLYHLPYLPLKRADTHNSCICSFSLSFPFPIKVWFSSHYYMVFCEKNHTFIRFWFRLITLLYDLRSNRSFFNHIQKSIIKTILFFLCK